MRTTALLYHDVVPVGCHDTSGFQGADADIYKLDREEFGRHLKLIPPQSSLQPVAATAAVPAAPDRRLFLTFDDGGSSAVYIGEVLAGRGWPGHFFITTGCVGTPGFLDAAEVRALYRAGHVIGSHSCTHPLRMGALSSTQLLREWRDSVASLQDILGAPVTTASIPGGYYSRAVASTAAEAGIRILFTSEPVTRTCLVDGCLLIGRFSVQQGVSAEWVEAVIANRRAPRLSRFLAWNGKKVLKVAGGSAWLSMRRGILSWQASAGERR